MSLLALMLAATGLAGGGSPYSLPTYRLEYELTGMIARDLDGDGRRELIGIDPDDDVVQILDAVPGLGWAPARTIATSPGPRAFLIVDATQDAIDDLVVAQASSVDVFPGLGGGAFGAPLRTFTTFAVGELAAGDLNGDGATDIVIVSGLGPIAVLLGTGGGTYAAPIVQSFAPSTVLRAWTLLLDGDQNADLALWLANADRIEFFRSLGDGSFAPLATKPLPAAPLDVELTDVDGDGAEDLTVIQPTQLLGPDRVYIFPGVAPGVFGPASVNRVELGRHRGHWEALDGDRRKDLLLEGELLPGVAFQDPGLRLDAELVVVAVQPQSPSAAATDATGDGRRDLVFAERALGAAEYQATVVVVEQVRERQLETDHILPSTRASVRVSAVDVNGDGADDAITLEASEQLGLAPLIQVVLSDGNGAFGPTHSVSLPVPVASQFGQLATGDFDGDGLLDVLAPTSAGTYLVLHAPDGSLAPAVQIVPDPPFSDGAGTGDVDDDGFDDALIGGRLYLGSPGGLVGSTLLSAGAGWTLADVTGDGALDAVRALAAPPRLETWVGDDAGGFATPVTALLPAFPAEAPLGVDVDGDGDADLAFRPDQGSFHGGPPVLLRSRGDGTFDPAARLATFRTQSAIRAADVNLDGAPDLVVATDAEVAVLLGVGDGSFPSIALHRALLQCPTELALGDFVPDAPPGILMALESFLPQSAFVKAGH